MRVLILSLLSRKKGCLHNLKYLPALPPSRSCLPLPHTTHERWLDIQTMPPMCNGILGLDAVEATWLGLGSGSQGQGRDEGEDDEDTSSPS